LVSRTMAIGTFELLYGRAELITELPALVAGMSAEQVANAAGRLRPDSRAVLIVEPAGGSMLEPASGSLAGQEA
ncbi:MAG: insulinase family protein, partial [Actinobacteria bacterium]|nr:insulinase family protein [Actinomycetota bacterium]